MRSKCSKCEISATTPAGRVDLAEIGIKVDEMKRFFGGLIWMLSLVAGPGQTVTNVVDAFNTVSYPNGSITNVWSNWFGGAFQSLSLDPASDANGNPASGSLKIVANFPVNTDQFTVWDGLNGISPPLNGIQFTKLQCDVRFAAGSATNSSGNYGNLQFGMGTPGYGQDYWNSGVTIPAGNTNWVHVSLPLDLDTDTNLNRIANVFVHIWGAGLSGPSTLWVDNLEFVGATSSGTATINYTNTQQRIDGFGASSAWMGAALSAPDADLVFSTNLGAGLSLLRTRIAPGGVIDDAEGAIAQEALARGARVWSTPWSPPAIYKTTNSVDGGSFASSTANYEGYASDLANYAATMKNSYGVNLYAVSLQNEPDAVVTYESCYWTAQQFHDFIPYLSSALTASNVAATKIVLPEDECWQWTFATTTMNDLTTSNLVGILGGHNYCGTDLPVTQFGTPCPKTVWETEHYLGTDDSITNGLALAQEIHTFLTEVNVSAYHYWWLIAGGGAGSLVDNYAAPAKRLFVMGNYSKFIRPNFYRVGVTNATTALVSAYKDSGSSNFVIVAANATAYPVDQAFVLVNFPALTNLTSWFTSATQSLASGTAVAVTNGVFNCLLPPWSVISFTTLNGANLALTNTDALNTSSFNASSDSGSLTNANWLGGQWPAYINDYFTGPYTLRTPAGDGDITFPGRSLTVQNPLGLYLKNSSGSVVTINRLMLTNGGGVCESLGPGSAFTLAGNLTVGGGQFYNSADATRAITNASTMSGAGALTNTGNGVVVFTGSNSAFTGELIVNSNTTLQAASQTNLGGNPPVFNAAQLTLDNGTFQPTASFALNNPNSGVTLNPNGGTFNLPSGVTLTVSNPLAGTGNLWCLGGGTLALAGTNTATGSLVVSNGTLALLGNAVLSNSQLAISNRATLDLSAFHAPLAVGGKIALAGNLVVRVNSGGASSQLAASNLVFGGSLTVSNAGPAFAAGNSFQLFSAAHYSGAFATLVPASPGANLFWNTNALAVSGTLSVAGIFPQFTLIGRAGTSLVIRGTNGGAPGNPFQVLSATNLAQPLSNWTILATNQFGPGGGFVFTNPWNPGALQSFLLLRLP